MAAMKRLLMLTFLLSLPAAPCRAKDYPYRWVYVSRSLRADSDTLENPKGWLEVLDRTPGARGIMYTTWQNKYELLGAFGDLVGSR